MDYIKKHKVKFIIVFVALILLILTLFGLKELLYPDSRKSYYGSRLDGIEKHNIDNNRLNKANLKIKDIKGVVDVKSNIKGRVVNFTVKVDETIDLISSQAIGQKILENFQESDLNFFDIQLFIDSDSKESEIYPIFGYKHKTSAAFKWSK